MRTLAATSARLVENCSSCGTRLLGRGTTTFPCPSCDEGKFGRCAQCRDQSVAFVCSKCGYEGP